MANEALIKGELGVHTQPMFKGELIAKPLAAAMGNFVKRDDAKAKQNAAKAGKIEEKIFATQKKGSFGGVHPNAKEAGEFAIRQSTDIYRKSGNEKDISTSDALVDDINFANKDFLKKNADFIAIVGDDDGEYTIGESANLSVGSSQKSVDAATAIYGGDRGITAYYNSETSEYEFSGGGVSVSQSDINKNIFEKNTKFGKMVVDESTRMASKDYTVASRYLDYNSQMKTKGQAVSAFHDAHIPGVPSVSQHLGEQNWANVDHKDFDLNKVKEETIKYYNQVLANEQAGYQQRKKDNPIKSNDKGSEKQRESNRFFKDFQTNLQAGDPSTIWGDNEVQLIEWRKNERYPTEKKLTLLYKKGTNEEIPGYNLATHPYPNAPALYTRGDKTFKFFDPNNQTDIQFLANKLKVNL